MSEIGLGVHTEEGAEIGWGSGALADALPPGVHPLDQSMPAAEYVPGPAEQGKAYTQGRRPFATPNGEAVPVWQRATTDWSTFAFTSISGTVQIGGKVGGRFAISVWVPTTAALGVQIGALRSQCDNSGGTPLNPGDSVTIMSEAPVFAAPQIGQTTGTVYVMDFFNTDVSGPK
jgi:hypothetical protein